MTNKTTTPRPLLVVGLDRKVSRRTAKDKLFTVRLTVADYDALSVLADQDRSTVAQQIRQAVARYLQSKTPKDKQITYYGIGG